MIEVPANADASASRRTIGGEPIKNIQQLLDLYAKHDRVNAVELGSSRGGKPLALTLRLR